MSGATNNDIESQLRTALNDISKNSMNMKNIDKTLELVDLSGISQNINKKIYHYRIKKNKIIIL